MFLKFNNYCKKHASPKPTCNTMASTQSQCIFQQPLDHAMRTNSDAHPLRWSTDATTITIFTATNISVGIDKGRAGGPWDAATPRRGK